MNLLWFLKRRRCERKRSKPAFGARKPGLLRSARNDGLRPLLTIIALVLLCSFSNILHAKPVELILWHSLAGQLGDELKQVVRTFNDSQQDFIIKPIYKGEYTDTITSFAAAFRAKKPPDMVQIYEVGTAAMLNPSGIIKPVSELMQEQGISLPLAEFLPALRNAYSKEGKLQALPFNTSIPVMYYNADAFKQIGLHHFPETWEGMEQAAMKLKLAGYDCAYTSAYPGWIQIESFAAIHGLPLFNAQQKAVYNDKAIIHHLNRLKKWQSLRYFQYGGRANDATVLFTSGRCAMFSQSSGSYQGIEELVTFHLGVANMPLDHQESTTRHNNVAGGAALWAVAGQTPEHYRGIALFYSYLAKPVTQQYWHQKTGYIPLGINNYYANSQAMPTLALAKNDLSAIVHTSSNITLTPQNQIRTINDEALEAIFAGIKTPEQALNEAVQRADFAIKRFARNTGS